VRERLSILNSKPRSLRAFPISTIRNPEILHLNAKNTGDGGIPVDEIQDPMEELGLDGLLRDASRLRVQEVLGNELED
jgi:hypothetical protein